MAKSTIEARQQIC